VDFSTFAAELSRWHPRGDENVIAVAEIDSTNLLARRIAVEYEDERQNLPRAYLFAWEQSAGRGREKRQWASPAGKGVYATLLTWIADPTHLAALPLLAGVALCRGLAPLLPQGEGVVDSFGPQRRAAAEGARRSEEANESTAERGPRLKWPNDVLVGGKKIGGLLIEAALRTDEGAIVMLGFGVNHSHRPEDLPIQAATSLEIEGGSASLSELAAHLAAALEQELEHLGDAAYAVAAYRELSAHKVGDRLVCRMGERTIAGTFLGFDDAGGLRLATGAVPLDALPGAPPQEEITISAGEVIA
jgi:BirA family biotin operon repressor/biotin-[acetyl-CoA-carboxylase] ligase